MTYRAPVVPAGLVLGIALAVGCAGAAAGSPSTPGAGSVVAVLDTGISAHPGLGWTLDEAGRGVPGGRMLAGYDFVSDSWAAADGDGWDPDPSDRGDGVRSGETPNRCAAQRSSWHGTNIAGTFADIAPGASIVPVRVMGRCGGSTSDVAAALLWAVGSPIPGVPTNPTPAKIVNLSLSGPSERCPRALQTAIDTAVSLGAVVMVAAGNQGGNTAVQSPANCANVTVVAATDRKGRRSPFSGFGEQVTLSALGGDMSERASNGIRTTTNKGRYRPGRPGYDYYQGASAATARVSAALARVAAAFPEESAPQWRDRLLQYLDPFRAGACDPGEGLCGRGILDLGRLTSSL